MSCLFCNIIEGKIPSNKVYENDHVFAFADINPQAPVHVLVVPKKHIKNIDELDADKSVIMSEIFLAVREIAKQKGLGKGYRVIINNNEAGGQVIWHLHVHILGGREDMGPMVVS